MSSAPHTQVREVGGRYRRMICLLLRRKEGQSLVELALTLPVLMTFMFGFMQVCMAFYTYDAISETAREGTRYAMVRGSSCVTSGGASCTVTAADVNTFAQGIHFLNGSNSAMTVATTYPDGNEAPGSRVKVSITYVFGFTIPFTAFKPITLSTSSMVYIIQ